MKWRGGVIDVSAEGNFPTVFASGASSYDISKETDILLGSGGWGVGGPAISRVEGFVSVTADVAINLSHSSEELLMTAGSVITIPADFNATNYPPGFTCVVHNMTGAAVTVTPSGSSTLLDVAGVAITSVPSGSSIRLFKVGQYPAFSGDWLGTIKD